MRILVHDFGGYAFALQLSRVLAKRGHAVFHAYCASHQTTPPGLDGAAAEDLQVIALKLRKPLDKYSFLTRWRQEREYGEHIAHACKAVRPDVVLSGNTPLSAQHRLMKACRRMRIPVVYWLQDLIGEAIYRILGKKLGLFGACVGRYFQWLERGMLRRSDAIIAISRDFVDHILRLGVDPRRIHVIENWADVTHISPSRHVPLAETLMASPCLLYTGTLSMKHNPALLLRLAKAVEGRAQVVVISQGLGAQWLLEQKQRHALPALRILPYQPLDDLPALYAAATVLVAVLEEAASVFSVPSKVLTYLAAGKPLLLAVPAANLAARMVLRAGAGMVTPPTDPDAFCAAALALLKDPRTRTRMGAAARTFAAEAFDIDRIAARFGAVLDEVTS